MVDTDEAPPWTVYILQCADLTFYTGITNNLDQRLAKHASGKGARYTRGRGPFQVMFCEHHSTQGQALQREAEIKKLSRQQKLTLIQTHPFTAD